MAIDSLLPEIVCTPPGPSSLALGRRLAAVECPGITYLDPDGTFPVFWESAAGSNVWDVDGNRYIDFTAAFGVAVCGHRHPSLVEAASHQMQHLVHGMGDVHPSRAKVELMEALLEVVPQPLGHAILGQNGSDAVEAAIKAAYLHTKRSGMIAFVDGYHGLSGFALGCTSQSKFREPFAPYLTDNVTFLNYPKGDFSKRKQEDISLDAALAAVQRRLADDSLPPVGAVIVEPVQARGGVVVPPHGFLHGLRELCDGVDTVLICDEIFTGFGRTGAWFACQHDGVVPDLIAVGKALTGGFPLSATLMTKAVAASWPESAGEAIHTSTFLGHPVACAVGVAAIKLMKTLSIPLRAELAGDRFMKRLRRALSGFSAVSEIRGRGMLIGVSMTADGRSEPSSRLVNRVMTAALRRGLLILPCGAAGDTLSITPPVTTSEAQLDAGVEILADAVAEAVSSGS